MYVCMEPCLKNIKKTWQLWHLPDIFLRHQWQWQGAKNWQKTVHHYHLSTVISVISWFSMFFSTYFSIWSILQKLILFQDLVSTVDFKIFQVVTHKVTSVASVTARGDSSTFDEWCGFLPKKSPVSGPLLWWYTLRGWLWTFHGGQRGGSDEAAPVLNNVFLCLEWQKNEGILVVYGGLWYNYGSLWWFMMVSYLSDTILKTSLASQTLSGFRFLTWLASLVFLGWLASNSVLHLIWYCKQLGCLQFSVWRFPKMGGYP